MWTQEEQERYSRHFKLDGFGESAQLKLKKAKVLVVGGGGLGNPVLQYLAAVGVGLIGIADDDVVSLSNLQRQTWFNTQHIGQLKAEVLKVLIKQLNPTVQVQTHTTRVGVDNVLDIVSNYDIVVDGTDNFASKYLLADAVEIVDKPLVFGSIYKYEGQLSVFNYQNGAGYRCLFPEPPSAMERPPCNEAGVLGVLPGIIGNYMALEVIKLITGLGEVLAGKLLMIDCLSNQHRLLQFKRTQTKKEQLEENYHFTCESADSNTISVQALHQKMKAQAIQLIDVREASEYAYCAIEGSKHIPMNDIPNSLAEIDLTQPVYLLCHHGMRSASVQAWLLENTEVKQAVNVAGGIDAWSRAIDTDLPLY